MDPSTTRKNFQCALTNIIENAPDKAQIELFNAYKAYKELRGRSWKQIRAWPFLEAIEDGLSGLFMKEELSQKELADDVR
jgi:hypothetical protein